MKVLGIAGSPRRDGNTDLLLAEVLRGAASKGAEVKTVVLSSLRFEPCTHCDGCLETGTCIIDDDMRDVYPELEAADRIVLASPIQFMGLTAHMKAMIDRCQCLWVRKYLLKVPPLGDERKRKGYFVSVGGTKFKNLFEAGKAVVRSLFTVLNIENAGELLFSGIDEKGAIKGHPDALKQAFELGQGMVEE